MGCRKVRMNCLDPLDRAEMAPNRLENGFRPFLQCTINVLIGHIIRVFGRSEEDVQKASMTASERLVCDCPEPRLVISALREETSPGFSGKRLFLPSPSREA